jgi:hypothetical protein
MFVMPAAGDASEVLNERAMAVMRRMTDKLMGRDHILEGSSATAECDSVPAQVQRLIAQAISHENLCQSYIGWCPFVSCGLNHYVGLLCCTCWWQHYWAGRRDSHRGKSMYLCPLWWVGCMNQRM